jgi:hypothetical protein
MWGRNDASTSRGRAAIGHGWGGNIQLSVAYMRFIDGIIKEEHM